MSHQFAPPYELSELCCHGFISALVCGSKEFPYFAVDENGHRVVEIITPRRSQKERVASVRAAQRHATFRSLLILSDMEYGFTVTFDDEDPTADCMRELREVLHEMVIAINRQNNQANSQFYNAALRSGLSGDDDLIAARSARRPKGR